MMVSSGGFSLTVFFDTCFSSLFSVCLGNTIIWALDLLDPISTF